MHKKETKLTLEQCLFGIGVMVATDNLTPQDREHIDIENTLAAAFVALGNDESKLRLLGPVFSWIDKHSSVVIIEKLVKILKALRNSGQDVSLAALAGYYAVYRRQRRWSPLKTFSDAADSGKFVGPSDIAESLFALRGEEKWAKGCNRILPEGVIQIESKWVLSKESLSKFNRQYRNRLIYGPQWRSDIITAIELGAKNPAEASRMTGASYEPCHRVFSELAAANWLYPKTMKTRMS